jgi:hypothetical protein
MLVVKVEAELKEPIMESSALSLELALLELAEY